MFHTKFVLTLGLLGTLLLSTGCASIVSDSSYNVNIDNKENQKITVRDESGAKVYRGTGSKSLQLKAGGGFNCMDYMIESPCGKTDIKAGVDGWVFGNILIGGIIGLIVDPMTGAACTLPNSVSVADCDVITEDTVTDG
jgi:hypothetical protein